MSDFIDPEEIGINKEQKGSLVERSWQQRESLLAEENESVSLQTSFEGASSMRTDSDHLTGADSGPSPASEQNLRKLLKDVEKIRKTNQPTAEAAPEPTPLYLDRFMERAQAHYNSHNFEACREVLREALKLAPGNPEILVLMEKTRKESQPRKAEPDLVDRIGNFKSEAIKLFEEGRYSDCVQRFKLLSELDPTNHDLRDYLEISQEQAEKQQTSGLNPGAAAPIQEQEIVLVKDPEPDRSAPISVSQPEAVQPPILIELQEPDSSEIPNVLIDAHTPSAQEAPSQDAIPESVSQPPRAALQPPSLPPIKEARPRDLKPDRKRSESEAALEAVTRAAGDPVPTSAARLKIFYLAGAGLLLGAMLGAWLALSPSKRPTDPEIQLQPGDSQASKYPSQLPTDPTAPVGDDVQTLAQRAFTQGRLLEANRFCETLLEKDPDNSFALNLRQEIRGRLSSLAGQAMAKQHWEEARAAWNNVLKLFPNDSEASRQLKSVRANLKKQDQTTLASKMELERRIQEVRQQISSAINSGHYLPPTAGNALELIQELESLSPDNSFGKEYLDQVFRSLMAGANRSLQAKDYVHANSLVRQIQTHFSERPELKALRERISSEETRFAETRTSWMQKAEAAMAAGHYVTPANDNVVAYCNQLLVLEPQNTKALGLKKETFVKAGTQAKGLVQEGKFDDARALYSALLNIPQSESQFGMNSQELKNEIDKLTFNAYAVIHDHAIGNCTGRLRFNGYQINYVPSSSSKDGFTLKLSDIVQVEPGEKLKIHLKGKTYRFQANATNTPQESQTKINEMHQRLSALVASTK